MGIVSRAAGADDLRDTAGLRRLFDRQRTAFAAERFPPLAVRRERIARLAAIVTRHGGELAAAIDRDFGHRPQQETRLAELYVVAAECRRTRTHLARWMRPKRVATPLHLAPGSAWVMPQPKGVAGIVSPWNYPVQLALAPAVAALAAGNRVMLKPSELTPATSTLLRDLVAASFAEDEFAVVLGDAEAGAAFTALPFDHLFFTGSTAVGRKVALAAAANLTPVTLELGGKSPALFDETADFDVAVPRLLAGKLLNAGQTCIAPDYALVPAGRVEAFEAAVGRAIVRMYPDALANRDYASIVNAGHYARLEALVDDARTRGARIVTFDDAHVSDARADAHGMARGDAHTGAAAPGGLPRRFPPTLVVGVDNGMAIMREEIFGPLLPVEPYASLDDAIARINARPHPLALYWFGADRARRKRVLEETLAGGVTLDDTLWHFIHDGLPFGGVGASGTGVYHGEHGFTTFSHVKPVFRQARIAAGSLLYPPYGRRFERVLAWLSRLTA